LSDSSENASLANLVRDLLLAMTYSQNEANKNFIADIEDLAGTDLAINYTKNVEGKKENREIKGNALAFGIMPTLLTIQSGIIEIRTAISMEKNTSSTGASGKNKQQRGEYLFKTATVDAKYQNAYNYKAESSCIIRLTVVPTPPTQALMETVKSVNKETPILDSPKP
jgi:hypothetical protein